MTSKAFLIHGLLIGLGLCAACNKSENDTHGSTRAAPERTSESDKSERSSSRKDESKSSSAADTNTKGAGRAGADGELGVKVCDDYIARVKSCSTGPKDSSVFKTLVDRWRKALDDGQRGKVEEACQKADKVFKCKG
jgi:hypothetical protein